MTRFAIPAAFGVAALIASSAFAQDQTAELENRISEMHDQYAAAFNAADAAGLAELYAEDAVVMSPTADPAEGRAAIEQLFADGFQQMSYSGLAIESREVQQIGDAVVDAGAYQATARPAGGEAMPIGGDYLSLVEQGDDGQWRIVRHIWNQDAAPETLVGEQ